MPLHPAIVHFPIALSVLVPVIAAGLLFAWHRGVLPSRVWIIAAALAVGMAGSGALAMRTGEGDEDWGERRAGEAAVERHEDRAKQFMAGAVVTAALAAAALALIRMRREPVAKAVALASAVASVATLGLGFRVGEAGGEIVYAAAPAGEGQGAVADRKDDDDRAGDDD